MYRIFIIKTITFPSKLFCQNESKLLSSIEFNVQSESDWLIIILTLAANVSLEKQLGTQLPKRKVEK
ncbi:hypothetical protein T07_1964 [Trichinella nelsoni]|uniref:Uncharacterized protein n=1 Tax=Trichinella nelsoni TaxID=6336 RepID=A0A0V0RKU6_9BILA|nr:hypothetical protein T07_1964 [Trichinella nelsoni]